MKPTEILSSEHRVIEQVLDCLERIGDVAGSRGALDRPSAAQALEVLTTFADRCHHGKEEGALFPMLEKRGLPGHVGPVAVMKSEHDVGRAAIARMRAALDEEKPFAFAASAHEYVELLRDHIAKEDGVLFPLAESVMRDEDRAEVLAAFERAEHDDLGTGVHERMLAIADELAERYGVARAAERVPASAHTCCGHKHGCH
jgi:hemerythrin-like domain-containing protein